VRAFSPSPLGYYGGMNDAAGASDYISVKEFREAEGMQDWPVLSDGATTFFQTDSFATAARLVRAIAELQGIEDHRPDIDVRAGGVTVRLLTAAGDWWGMSRRDVELARRISAAAAELGLPAHPTTVQSVDPIVVGAVDIKKVMPFWQALMGYEQRADSPDEDLVDPRGRGPGIWFEQVDGWRAGRNRMHVAVWVPYDQAEARVAAAIAAGGTVIYDEQAPAWWTLADAEGNEADVATSMSRDA
jgi:4a-hydroxytetrahydrobiopterin dehydratase